MIEAILNDNRALASDAATLLFFYSNLVLYKVAPLQDYYLGFRVIQSSGSSMTLLTSAQEALLECAQMTSAWHSQVSQH